jgi:hypothetical protein
MNEKMCPTKRIVLVHVSDEVRKMRHSQKLIELCQRKSGICREFGIPPKEELPSLTIRPMDAIAPSVTLPPDDSAAQPPHAHHSRLEFDNTSPHIRSGW